MKNFWYKLTHNWHFMRLLRLVLGIIISVQAVKSLDWLSGAIAVILLYQAVADSGCCGSPVCAAPPKTNPGSDINDIEYQEIK